MSIELCMSSPEWPGATIAKIVQCGYGRHPNGLDIQLCPETLLVRSDGSWRHIPEGLNEESEELVVKSPAEYGRCREHGRVAVFNAIPPRENKL